MKTGRKERKKGVRFAEEEEVLEFDKRDAPGLNIFEVTSAKTLDQAAIKAEQLGTAISGAAPPTPQKWGLHEIEGEMRMEFDTDLMTVSELRQALASRNLDTKGKKAELKRRLEEDIIREKGSPPGQPSSKPEPKSKQNPSVPDWLSWD